MLEDEKHGHAHVHNHRQSSLEQTALQLRPATADTRPATAEGAKGQQGKPWPDPAPVIETTPRKKLEVSLDLKKKPISHILLTRFDK